MLTISQHALLAVVLRRMLGRNADILAPVEALRVAEGGIAALVAVEEVCRLLPGTGIARYMAAVRAVDAAGILVVARLPWAGDVARERIGAILDEAALAPTDAREG